MNTFNDLIKDIHTNYQDTRNIQGHFEWKFRTKLPVLKVAAIIGSVELKVDKLTTLCIDKATLN